MVTCGTEGALVYPACESAGPLDSCSIPASAFAAPRLHSPPAPLAEPKPTVGSFQKLIVQNQGLPVTLLAYNAFDRRLYAALGANYTLHPNSIAVIDPVLLGVPQFVALGVTPTALALSDDGQVMWVAASDGLRRIDLTTLTVSAPVAQGVSTKSIAVLPGTRDSVLVLGQSGVSGTYTLRVYDNGVVRPIAGDAESSLLTATNSPSLAYGFNNLSSKHNFATYCINAQGAFPQRSDEGLLPNGNTALMFDSGFVYGNAAAYDVARQRQAGTFAGGYAVAVDSVARRIFTLNFSGVRVFDMDTFAMLADDYTLPYGNSARSAQLVRWGRYGLAFSYTDDFSAPAVLYVGRSTLIP